MARKGHSGVSVCYIAQDKFLNLHVDCNNIKMDLFIIIIIINF
jgi:hypothetical protein